jgi:ATP-dependent Clp protease ATP-binding subunit ClpC
VYERFTDRSRKVMQLANQEAQRFCHEYVGTEHILLGLIKEGTGVAANVLKNLDMDLNKLRREVEKIVQAGPDMVTMGKMPMTPRAKKSLEYAIEEAQVLGHNYIGTEHLLLGLLRELEGIAIQALNNLGVKIEDVREEILNLLGHPDPERKEEAQEATGRTVGEFVTNVSIPATSMLPDDKIADVMVFNQIESIMRNKGRTPVRKIMEDIQQMLNDHFRDPPDLSEA